MQSETKPENVGSGDSLKVLQPLENVGSSTTSMRSEGEHNDKHGEYISQQHIIKKKMLELSPAEDLYTPAMARFQYLIHSQYDDNDYAEGWKRWRAESLLWDYYCEFFKYLLTSLQLTIFSLLRTVPRQEAPQSSGVYPVGGLIERRDV
jgi:hypothetical protein